MARVAPAASKVARESLLEAGAKLMLEQGYNNTGIQEILDATGIPKGSFYHYYQSKEDFALQVIDYFEQHYAEKSRLYLEDKKYDPVQRLHNYCQEGMQLFEQNKCKNGCLVGNLSQEMSDQSEILRAKLEEVLTKWRNRFAACIKEGQDSGQISPDLDRIQLAEFFLSGWHGAILRAKTTKNTAPQLAFIEMMFGHVLKPKA